MAEYKVLPSSLTSIPDFCRTSFTISRLNPLLTPLEIPAKLAVFSNIEGKPSCKDRNQELGRKLLLIRIKYVFEYLNKSCPMVELESWNPDINRPRIHQKQQLF